ncbi:trk system potassium uptake protein TrkA [Caldalkalibacillus uzonensis]|uniref:Trk system potassium uptake protein TrkA n=1 Tax=Caldalkalibacillus uzonensis TaxID=353224 RepID=A0ABU0CTG3_9BACI|nr:TrkA family potassium uptake protein [Caldalkalibacillus uzonensis]MDQ0339715.1 trk system potassium uptake protein TrkA [Caldalkalibacillus uzonensis]
MKQLKRSFLVIGLGRFGESITKTLSSLGHEVMAIDKDEGKVNKVADLVTQAVQADGTDEGVLRELGVSNLDEAIVAIGDDIQASILTTLILKDMGFNRIVVKAKNDYHSKVLEKIGADMIVHPEKDMGVRVAHSILSGNIIDFIELSPDYSLFEVSASEKMNGRSLKELNLRAKYGCTVMAIKPKDEGKINISPNASDVVKTGDVLVLVGTNRDLNKLEQELLE